ncbi:MAG: glycosyltransferase family 2 protein [Phycisphaerales bacterium]|jgi:glycosyltransferase involved in cell wall biosynthesis|nr:glycosyltransferase family 2 protein [Phycisphaerales bacterium]
MMMWEAKDNPRGAGAPRVSIGLPVYNGQAYLATAMDSLLAQTYRDFELIVCDNASTDGTEGICRKYAKQDCRVRYVRQVHNVGAAGNFNRTAELARGEYFRWAAHDDVCGPTLLERCVEALDANPQAVLAHGQVAIIDHAGQVIATPDGNGMANLLDPAREMESADPARRFYELLLRTKWCFEIFGLIRKQVLMRTRLHEPFYGSDKVILATLCLSGAFVTVPQVLFYRRYHPDSSTSLKDSTQRNAWIGGGKSQKSARLQCLGGYARAIREADMPSWTRVRCLGVLGKYVGQFQKWRWPLAS